MQARTWAKLRFRRVSATNLLQAAQAEGGQEIKFSIHDKMQASKTSTSESSDLHYKKKVTAQAQACRGLEWIRIEKKANEFPIPK